MKDITLKLNGEEYECRISPDNEIFSDQNILNMSEFIEGLKPGEESFYYTSMYDLLKEYSNISIDNKI